MALHDYKICVATLVDTLYSNTPHNAWITLEDYEDFEALEARVERLIDASPTRCIGEAQGIEVKQSRAYLIQEYEGFPQREINETTSLETIWDLWETFQQAIEDDNEEAFTAYLSNFWGGSYDDFQDRYHGCYDSKEEYARQFLDATGTLNAIPENLRHYFDYEMYARDLFISDMTMIDGYVFSNC